MKNRVVWLMAAALLAFSVCGPAYAQVENLLDNGGFEDGAMAPWSTYGGVTATVVQDDPAEGLYCLHLDVATLGTNSWDVGLQRRLVA